MPDLAERARNELKLPKPRDPPGWKYVDQAIHSRPAVSHHTQLGNAAVRAERSPV